MAARGVLYTSDGGGGTSANGEDGDPNDDYFGVQTPPTRSFMKLVPRALKTQGEPGICAVGLKGGGR